MIARSLAGALLVCVAAIVPAGAGTEVKRDAIVRIVVVDGMGGKLYGGKITVFRNKRTAENFAPRFHIDRFLDQTASRIPYGVYELRITQPRFPDAERVVLVSRATVDVQVCVRTSTVHVVDTGPLRAADEGLNVLSFTSREDALDLARSFHHGTAGKVPYGIYDLRVTRPFARELQRRVDVFQPDVWVVVELELSAISLPEYRAPRWAITGTIKNISSDEEPVYVSLIAIHGNFRIDDKVKLTGTHGEFALSGFNPAGKFLLVTSGRNRILDVRQVDIPNKSPIVIDLADKTAQE